MRVRHYNGGLILTLTVNPAIDRTISVDRLAFEDRAYINSRHDSGGGRGINAACVIHSFGGHQQLGYRYLSIRVAPGHEADVLALVQKGFRDMPSRRTFSYENLSDRVDKQYAFLEGLAGVTNYVAILTVFIAAMGLFGLVALFTRQRVKEVGIRKVLGAGTGDIVGMLSRSFLLLILLSLVIASPIAWWIMHAWLQDFAYRITIQWWMLLGAGGIALAIGVFTIGWHALRTARANPVDSLRSE